MAEKTDKIQRVHIWEDPESKINFLETTMHGKKWRAAIHPATADGSVGNLPEVQQKLESKGYLTKLGTDRENKPVLWVTKLGSETMFLDAIEKLGVTQGIRHSFENIGFAFNKLISTARNILNYWTENKAKRIGALYLMGDVIIADNAFSDTSPEAWMKGTYGILGAAQSLIFMNFATEADAQIAKEVNRKFANHMKNGLALDTNLDWLEDKDPAKKSLKFMEKNAIVAGSLTQITGRLLWAAAGVSEIRGKREGGWERISDAAMSIFGWVMFMLKDDKPKDQKPKNIGDFFKRHSNRIGGTLNAGSTVAALWGASKKMAAGENAKQDLFGNIAYLLGDATVYITDTMDYDEKSATHPNTLGRVGANFLQAMPLILGESGKAEVASRLALHLSQRAHEIEKAKNKKDYTEEDVKNKSDAIYNAIFTQLPYPDQGLASLAAKAADITLMFPETKRAELTTVLAKALSESNAIFASANEIAGRMDESIMRKRFVPSGSKLVQMQDVQAPLADLVATIPSTPNQAETAIALFDAIRPYLSRDKGTKDTERFENEMEKLFTKKEHTRINSSTPSQLVH